MILKSELISIGKVLKTHGVKGELLLCFDDMCFDEKNLPFLVFDIDGLFIPFFVESINIKSFSTFLVKFDGLNNESYAKLFVDKIIFLHIKYKDSLLNEEKDSFLIGYKIFDKYKGYIGIIKDIDDSTINNLFIVDKNGEDIMIPIVDDFIDNIDNEEKTIFMKLPLGLINLDDAEIE